MIVAALDVKSILEARWVNSRTPIVTMLVWQLFKFVCFFLFSIYFEWACQDF